MRNLFKNYAWLVVLTVIVNTAGRFLPEGFTYPLGNIYNSIAGYLYSRDIKLLATVFSDAAHRQLSPGNGYFLFDALSWCIIGLFAVKVTKHYQRIPAIFFFGVSINNLVDELILNPTKFEWMEAAIAVIVLLICADEYRRVKASTR